MSAQLEEWAAYDGPRGPLCKPINCPDCGKFSSESWDTGGSHTPDGYWQAWGGVCKTHGRWSDST